MKEDLVDYDGKTRLFKGRTAENHSVPLSAAEYALLPGRTRHGRRSSSRQRPQPLARMVYGKRAASSLYALAETLRAPPRPHGRHERGRGRASTPTDSDGDEAESRRSQGHPRRLTCRPRGAHGHQGDCVDRSRRDPRRVRHGRRRSGDAWPTTAWPATGSFPATASRRSSSPSTPTPPTGSPSGSHAEGYTARVYSGRQSNPERDEVRESVHARRLPDHRVHRRRQRGHRPAGRPRPGQLRHPLVAGAPRAADGPHPPGRPDPRRRTSTTSSPPTPAKATRSCACSTTSSPPPTSSTARCSTACPLVAEITGVDYEQLADRPLRQRRGQAGRPRIDAADAVRAARPEDPRRPPGPRQPRRRLASRRSTPVAALTLLQRDLLARDQPRHRRGLPRPARRRRHR